MTQQAGRAHARQTQVRAVITRQGLLEAAATVFDERGYHATSISDIVARGATTKGSLYFHFASKEALARGVMVVHGDGIPLFDRHTQGIIDATFLIGRRLRTDVYLRAGVRLAIEAPPFLEPDTDPFKIWLERSTEGFIGAKAAGELLPHVDPHACAQLLVGAFAGVQLLSERSCVRTDLPQRLADLWTTLLPGIVTKETLVRLVVERPGSPDS